MERNVIRIRVDLSDSGVPALFRYVWVSVNHTMLNTIRDFKKLLSEKFKLNENEIHLYCQQCLLPSDETIFILRDEDTVKVVYKDKLALNVKSPNNTSEVSNDMQNINRCEEIIKESQEQPDISQGDFTCKRKSTSKKRCVESLSATPSSKKVHYTNGKKSKITEDNSIVQETISEMDTSFNQNETKVKKKKKKYKAEKEHPLQTQCEEFTNKTDHSFQHNCITDNSNINELKMQQSGIDKTPEKINTSESKNTYAENSQDSVQKEITNKEPQPKFQEALPPGEISLSSEESSFKEGTPETKGILPEQSPINQNSEYSKTSELNISQFSGNNCRKRKRKHKQVRKPTLYSVGDVLATLGNTTMAVSNITTPEVAKLSECSSLNNKISGGKVEIENVQECGRKHIRFLDASDESENIISPKTPSSGIAEDVKQNTVGNSSNNIPLWMVWGTPVSKVNNTVAENVSSLSTTCKDQETVEQGRSLESLTKLLPLNIMPNGLTKASNNILPSAEASDQAEIKKPNYMEYPDLNTQPSPGDLIAFKILELSESYCPEVSEYKEGRVKSIDPESDNVEMELISEELKEPRIGKFENLYPDETPKAEVVKTVKVRWSSVIEPKLLSS